MPANTFVSPCLKCALRHPLEECPQMKGLMHKEKLNFLKEKVVCFGCLCIGNLSKDCNKCMSSKICNQTHPSLLHVKQIESKNEHDKNEKVISACSQTGAGNSNGFLPILPVNVKSAKGDKLIQTYAFLDAGSTDSFCYETLMDKLKITGKKQRFSCRPWVKIQQCQATLSRTWKYLDTWTINFFSFQTCSLKRKCQ